MPRDCHLPPLHPPSLHHQVPLATAGPTSTSVGVPWTLTFIWQLLLPPTVTASTPQSKDGPCNGSSPLWAQPWARDPGQKDSFHKTWLSSTRRKRVFLLSFWVKAVRTASGYLSGPTPRGHLSPVWSQLYSWIALVYKSTNLMFCLS